MIVHNLSTNGNSNKHQILAFAQTIANFFVDAMEQNDCNVKVVMGYYNEIYDTVNTIKDMKEAVKPYAITFAPWNYKPNTTKPSHTLIYTETNYILTTAGMEATIEALKEKCFSCKLSLPKLRLDYKFKFLHNKLSFQLQVYDNVFKFPHLQKINYCHAIFAFKNSCVPDLMRFIALLLQAVTSILALNKLPRFTLAFFVNAIIGKLLASIVASLNISIDMSQTGLPCVIAAIEEIAAQIPSPENISKILPSDPKTRAFIKGNYKTIAEHNTIVDQNLAKAKEDYDTVLKKDLEALKARREQGWFTDKDFKEVVDHNIEQNKQLKLRAERIANEKKQEYRRKQDPVNFYKDKLLEKVDEKEREVSLIFKQISNTVQKAQDDVNGYINSILGVINYFECESKRSGSDFSEIIEYINNINNIINFISSLISTYIRKVIGIDLCTEETTIKKLQEKLSKTDSTPLGTLSNKEIEEIMSDFLESQVKIDEDGLSVLLYDKPKAPLVPKLSLMGCNLKEFAESHQLPNLIARVVEERLNTPNKDNTSIDPYVPEIKFPDHPVTKLVDLPVSPIVLDPRNYYVPIKVTLPPISNKVYEYIPNKKLLEKIRHPYIPSLNIPGITVRPSTDEGDLPTSLLNNNPYNPINVPDLFKPIKDLQDKRKGTSQQVGEVLATVPLLGDIQNGNGLSILDELDSILDLIYSNPPQTKENPGKEPLEELEENYYNIIEQDRDKYFKNNALTECRTVEDVMRVLSSINIR